jgi:hypothetical protein
VSVIYVKYGGRKVWGGYLSSDKCNLWPAWLLVHICVAIRKSAQLTTGSSSWLASLWYRKSGVDDVWLC